MLTMKQTLLSACAISAIALASAPVSAATIYGGGSSLAARVYTQEFLQSLATLDPSSTFNYTKSSSGQGQAGFFSNNGADSIPTNEPTGVTIAFGASDSVLSAAQITAWNTPGSTLTIVDKTAVPPKTLTYTVVGKATSGALLQIPTFGTAVALPYNFPGVQGNGSLQISNDDLCGVLSGKITDWGGLTNPPAGAAGHTINLVVRSDTSGTTFLLTSHLLSACTAANTATGVHFGIPGSTPGTFVPTQQFSDVFVKNGQAVPTNITQVSGSSGIQTALTNTTYSLGYVSPDYTSIAAINRALGLPDVAAVQNSNNGTYYPSDIASTQAAIQSIEPYTITNPADPTQYVPNSLLASPSTGYPIVGYTTWDLAQCYADSATSAGIKTFVSNIYRSGLLKKTVAQNGFVNASTSIASAVINNIVNNSTSNVDIGNATACAGIGR